MAGPAWAGRMGWAELAARPVVASRRGEPGCCAGRDGWTSRPAGPEWPFLFSCLFASFSIFLSMPWLHDTHMSCQALVYQYGGPLGSTRVLGFISKDWQNDLYKHI